MSTLKIAIRDLPRVQARLGRSFLPAIKAGLYAGALRCLPVLQQETRDAPPAKPGGSHRGAVNTGAFLRGWKARREKDGAAVHNRAPHAPFVEHGRRPGRMPPVRAIARWARQRGIAGGRKRGEGGRFTATTGVAWAIARAIGRRGLRGREILERLKGRLEQLVHEEAMRGLDKALKAGGR